MIKIPVVFATDENYVFYTCVAITSLSRSASSETEYDIYILTDSGFPDKSLLNSVEQRFCNIQIKIIRVKNEMFRDVIINNGHVTKATFYRLALCNLIDAEKCIYLDSDVIVTEDLQDLFLTEMNGYYVAGCRDIWIDLLSEQDCENRRMCTGIPSMKEYVNAGVMVMNLQKMRTDGLDRIFMRHMNRSYLYEDQDIINVCCYGNIKRLPAKWNIFTVFLGHLDQLRLNAISETVIDDFRKAEGIIHYATVAIRPWEHFFCWANWRWWDIASEWREELCYQRIVKKLQKKEELEHWEYYLKTCEKYKNIIIFGFTIYGRQICDWLLNSGYQYKIMFCDNNPEKRNLVYKGIRVFSLEEIDKKDSVFVNTSQSRCAEVMRMLGNADIVQDDILCYKFRNREFYKYLDRRYYLYELKDVFLRECGAERRGFCEDLLKMRKILVEDQQYKEWHDRYFMKEWILREEE